MAITLHEGQTLVYEDIFIDAVQRFSVVCCSRGWGKSYMAAVCAITATFELIPLKKEIPNKFVYIIAPTYDQVTDIYYPLIMYELGMKDYVIDSSRALGRFIFQNGVELRLLSYEAIERLRGKGAYFIVWDEICSCKKGLTPKKAWEGIIQPAIITRWSNRRALTYGAPAPGRSLMIGTPKGYDDFHTFFNFREVDNMWGSYHFDYRESPLLIPEEIEKLKHILDPIEYASEYLASFAESGNNVFYSFDRNRHVTDLLPYFVDGEDVHINIDFNVGIQASSVFALRGNQMQFIDEFKGHPDTDTLGRSIKKKFKGHKIFAYPDPSGRARKTSAPVGTTDFTILKSHNIICRSRKKAPPIVDSVAAVNRMLKTASGEVNMLFHPRCKGTIMSVERTKWMDRNPDTATLDKSEGIEHFSDGIRYGSEFLFPIKKNFTQIYRSFKF